MLSVGKKALENFGADILADHSVDLTDSKGAEDMLFNWKEKAYLKANPLCIVCYKQGRYTKATKMWVHTNGEKEPRCDKHSCSKIL